MRALKEEIPVTGLDKELLGLQHAIRNLNEQLNQTVVLLGMVRQEFEMEKAKVKRLQLDMQEVTTYINKTR
jgi:hypothetical protein